MSVITKMIDSGAWNGYTNSSVNPYSKYFIEFDSTEGITYTLPLPSIQLYKKPDSRNTHFYYRINDIEVLENVYNEIRNLLFNTIIPCCAENKKV